MPVIEAYATNPTMRDRYIRMNGITHVEAWDTDNGYIPALCGGNGEGWPEHGREFATIGQVAAWSAKFCPELPFRN